MTYLRVKLIRNRKPIWRCQQNIVRSMSLLVPLMLSTHQVSWLPSIPSFCLPTLMSSIPQYSHNGTPHRNVVFWRLLYPTRIDLFSWDHFMYVPSQWEMMLHSLKRHLPLAGCIHKMIPVQLVMWNYIKDKLGKSLFKCCTKMKWIVNFMSIVQICSDPDIA